MTKRTQQTKTAIYRRHAGGCPIKTQPLNTANCECLLWIHGKVRGKLIRKSLNTRTVSTAEMYQRDIEEGGHEDDSTPGGPQLVNGPPRKSGSETLEYAAAEFLKTTTDLSSSTQTLYRRAVTDFCEWARKQKTDLVLLRSVESAHIREYLKAHVEWSRTTAQGRLVHLSVFFNFCKKSRRWLTFTPTEDPSLSQRGKKANSKPPRYPYTTAEVTRILAAVERMPEDKRDIARALVYLLLYSGMRISDATFAERECLLPNHNMAYYVIKTGKKIDLAPELQQPAIDALKRLPASRTYFFHPDVPGDYREARQALRYTAMGEFSLLMPGYEAKIQATSKIVKRVLKLAGVAGTCHKFRDTFAMSLLIGDSNGKALGIWDVSRMLGHSDVRITNDHYTRLIPEYAEKLSQGTRVLSYQFPQAS